MFWNVGMNYDMVGVQADDFKSSDKKAHAIFILNDFWFSGFLTKYYLLSAYYKNLKLKQHSLLVLS